VLRIEHSCRLARPAQTLSVDETCEQRQALARGRSR